MSEIFVQITTETYFNILRRSINLQDWADINIIDDDLVCLNDHSKKWILNELIWKCRDLCFDVFILRVKECKFFIQHKSYLKVA